MKIEYEFKKQRELMVKALIREGVLKSKEVKRAFLTVPREEFVWPDMKSSAYYDTPLPLGATGQTISAPHMVAIMLEEMWLEEGMLVLEIGAGSGYSAALTAEIVNPTGFKDSGGQVVTIERVRSLIEFAKSNLEKTGYADRVKVVEGDGTLGYPEECEEEIYDRIVVTAAAPKTPIFLKKQLKRGGILLIPVGDLYIQRLMKLTKSEDGSFKSKHVCDCMFVPLIGCDGYQNS